MQSRKVRLLHVAVAVLQLLTVATHARSTDASAQGRERLAARSNHERRTLSCVKRSTAAVPWVPFATDLRGGGVEVKAAARAPLSGIRRSASICGLFSLSYLCSVLFNVNNKRALQLVPLPWTYATVNLLIGSAVALASWSAKVAPWPRISRQDLGALVPMGFLHAVSHLTVVLGLGAGAVAFLQTVKASEACFTAVLSYLFLGQTLPLPVYLTLLPVVVGVALTCCGQGLRFSWVALVSALVSNLSNALRNVLIVKNVGPGAAGRRRGRNKKHCENKKTGAAAARAAADSFFLRSASTSGGGTATATAATAFLNTPTQPRKSGRGGAAALASACVGGGKEERSGLADLAPGDTYRLLTTIGAGLLIPAAALMERKSWPRLFRAALAGGSGGGSSGEEGDLWAQAVRHALLSGVCFNLFYDLTFRLLGQLHPVTHAVGNTIKRIVVIGAGALVFGGDLGGTWGALGSTLAVVGVLGYSVAKARCKAS